jgi:transcription antitermination factor NusG
MDTVMGITKNEVNYSIWDEIYLMKPSISYELQPVVKKSIQPSWYVVYTRPHHEKKVYKQLQQEKIDAFLPLQTTLRYWSYRTKRVSEPLFNCYLFVYISTKEYYTVLNVPGIVNYITFEGKAATISKNQIKLIKNILEQDIETEEVSVIIQKGT